MVLSRLQNDLHGLAGPVVDGHGTAEIHRAVCHRAAHHTQGVEAQLLTALHSQRAQLLPRKDGGVVRLQGKGVHGHESQLGRPDTLEAQQAPLAPLEGHKAEFLLLLEAEEALLKAEQVFPGALHLTEILGLQQHV